MPYDEIEDIDSTETTLPGVSFDIKGFLFKVLKFWKLFVLCITVGLVVAYLINVRKQNVYRLSSLISIENDQNPFFAANTSISFNWGGVSGKVGKVMIAMGTRNHNEKVVDSLGFYIQYLRQGEYRKVDVYKNAPFFVDIDNTKPQVLGRAITIRFLSDSKFELTIDFTSDKVKGQTYSDKTISNISVPIGKYSEVFNIGEYVELPFAAFRLHVRPGKVIVPNSEYFVQFLNFDSVVNKYRGAVSVRPYSKTSSSILTLSLNGYNKGKIVDYLNTTASILAQTDLEYKNLYATNTIKFIDSSLSVVGDTLKAANYTMNAFRKKNKIFDVSDELDEVSNKISTLDLDKEANESKLQYLNILENYLRTKTDYTKIAAPTSVGIEENNISSSVSKITTLSIQRQELEQLVQEGSSSLKELDGSIDAEKNVLLETIASTKRTINIRQQIIRTNKLNLEERLNELPEDQQEFLKIQRKLALSQESYNVFLAKRSEAAIIRAANVSDILVIERAKDVGNGPIGPNRNLNYMMALVIGFFGPLILVFVLFLLDNTIHGTDEIKRLSRIPIIGLIGKYEHESNLVVFDKPKSAVAEAFRSVRSSLQFFYKKMDKQGGRTIMLTSSVSGEGKTFCSINIASAYALSGKKTLLLGLDLRKPKIFDDFEINNSIGIVNYLIGNKTLEEVTCVSHVNNLEIITSGPIPPNPSELLMSDLMRDLIAELRGIYDIIVLDTPPLGLVTDALILSQYADASLFVIRLDYTKRVMLELVNEKYRSGELKNISFILNFYKSNLKYGYGGYGYGYGYGSYGDAYHESYRDKSFMDKIRDVLKKIKLFKIL